MKIWCEKNLSVQILIYTWKETGSFNYPLPPWVGQMHSIACSLLANAIELYSGMCYGINIYVIAAYMFSFVEKMTLFKFESRFLTQTHICK